MTQLDVDQLDLLVAALAEPASRAADDSAGLRRALRAAVALGFRADPGKSPDAATRRDLEAFAVRAALEEHYRRYPEARPTVAEVAEALAVIDRNPLAERPDLLRRAADEVGRESAEPDPEDVLLRAAQLLAHESDARDSCAIPTATPDRSRG